MKRVFSLLIYLLVVGYSSVAEAQNVTTLGISGKVTDQTGNPIPFANVILDARKNLVGVTDENGKYTLSGIAAGKYELVVRSIGYEEQKRSVATAETRIVDFILKENTSTLNEVLVKGNKQKAEVEKLKTSGFSVNALDLTEFQNLGSDLNQVLARTSGVRVRETGGMGSNFEFSINGLSGKQIRYFIDGVPMDIFGSSMTLNNIPVNLAERVEVYKGVVPVTLGSDAMGGAVNIITNQKVRNYLDASYSIGSFNSHRTAVTGQYTLPGKSGIVIRANAFHNYSDNNYMMRDVEVWDEELYEYVPRNFRRFHDQYQSAMGRIEAGVLNKKWADVFFVGASYSRTDKDVQTGFRQHIVFGDVFRTGNNTSGLVTYRKDNVLLEGLNLSLFGSISKDYQITADTAMYQYGWDGNRIKRSSAEMGGNRAITHLIRPKTFVRGNLGYELNKQHSFNLNYTYDQVENRTYNELIMDRDPSPGRLGKGVLGLAYQGNFWGDRLVTQAFAKMYQIRLKQNQWSNIAYDYVSQDTVINNYGYGVTGRLKVSKTTGLKFSYEKAYRLQEVEEMFGDGLTIMANPVLRPEQGNNYNAGFFQGFTFGKHYLFFEGGAFYRNAKDFIYAVPYERNNAMQFENKSSVLIKGGEAELRYTFSELLSFTVNATYQNAINTTQFVKAGSTIPEATYLNKIPNRPWFFANADFGIGKSNVIAKNDRVQFNYNSQYVNWFYLTWEAYGDKRGKAIIPTQVIHNASAAYSFLNGKYNVSLEARNFTNALAFDNFKLQKPGRAFNVKLRYFIR
jgi:outer membrane receptor protein involved in Fe transport